MRSLRSLSLSLAALLPFGLLTGCALENTAAPTEVQGVALQGMVHGGKQPVVGAKVFLLQANTTGYGGAGITASSVNASKSLLTTGTVDTAAATLGFRYVTTDGNGSFSITGDYTCTANTQVYLYAVGGNTGAGTNSSAGFLSLIGNCPSTGTFLSTVPYIWVNEVTTIAAAYAVAGFASDALHISSSGTTLAKVGIANAFANFSTLVNVATGVPYAVNPHNSSGTVPQSELNTLADILAACVNSTDAAPQNCSNLFGYVKSNGTSGSVATDTATEAIYIAQHPGVAVTSLYGLQAATAAPFQPSLSAAPNDFTVGIVHHNNGLREPIQVAIDAQGYAWVAEEDSSDANYGLSGFTNLGAVAPNSPVALDATNHMDFPQGLAIDQSGSIWVVNQSSGSSPYPYLSKFTSAGADAGSFSGNSMYISNGIAIDPTGDVWVTNTGSGGSSALSRFTSSGAAAGNSPITLASSVGATGIAISASGYVYTADGDFNGNDANIHRVLETASGTSAAIATSSSSLGLDAVDASGNVWIADENANDVIKVNSAGAAVSGSPFAASLAPYAVAMDGSSNVWLSGGSASVAELNNAGTQISPASGGYGNAAASGFQALLSVAIDGSGDVWVTDYYGNALIELIGAAVPVVTPISANLVAPYGTYSVNKP